MNPARNPSEERLLAYAAGTLSPPEAVVVAAHLALRPANNAWVRRLQSLGGEFLEEAQPSTLSDGALARAMARIETDAGEAARAPPPPNDMPELPEPLRRYALGRWRWIGPGIRARDVHAPRDGDCRVILLKIDPGRATPRHTHGGVELTCVLSGAYATETTRFDVRVATAPICFPSLGAGTGKPHSPGVPGAASYSKSVFQLVSWIMRFNSLIFLARSSDCF